MSLRLLFYSMSWRCPDTSLISSSLYIVQRSKPLPFTIKLSYEKQLRNILKRPPLSAIWKVKWSMAITWTRLRTGWRPYTTASSASSRPSSISASSPFTLKTKRSVFGLKKISLILRQFHNPKPWLNRGHSFLTAIAKIYQKCKFVFWFPSSSFILGLLPKNWNWTKISNKNSLYWTFCEWITKF